ncbi:DUF1697 domain-containing protein [Halobacillus salinarum]|uniref:DUF1697 domain-containing protein n=1 Tax=Halobacillus salinarum TaxID=2932257 RepID=A0ABY4EP93_9BACI|nr:DUF1697 domain-containing protein [Halobacillus salinarum]UOQ45973.1 DUF1697 domain-containing protein [Halobacillus salinarum]
MQYIAFLRGINVGGKNKIKMAELRKLMEEKSLTKVRTYIQSGNILFESDRKENELINHLEVSIHERFGFFVPVIIRTAAELQSILVRCPFSEEEIAAAASSAAGECLYLALLQEIPSPEASQSLLSLNSEGETCQLEERQVYLLVHDTIRKSKVADYLNKQFSPVTIRNWKTIRKLVSMAES